MRGIFGQAFLVLLAWFSPMCAADDAAKRALDRYAEQIQSLGNSKSDVHPDLIEPYQSLSEIYFQQEDYANAASMLNTAIQIRRVSDGLFHKPLIPYLERLAHFYWLGKKFDRADQVRKNITEISLYQRDRHGLEALRAYNQLALWYQSTGRYGRARLKLKTITRIIRRNLGKNATEQAPFLVRIAETYRAEQTELDPDLLPEFNDIGRQEAEYIYHRTYMTPAVSVLKRAKALYDQNLNESTMDSLAEVNVLLGDWYMSADRPQQASTYYQRAHDLLRGNGHLDNHAKLFAAPLLLRFPKLNPKVGRYPSDDDLNEIILKLSYTVTSKGRMANLKVTELQPPNSVRVDRSEIVRIARYRPVFSSNQLVDTHDVRHAYRYNFRTGETSSVIVQ